MKKTNRSDRAVNIIGATMLGIMMMLSAFNIFCSWLTGIRYAQIEETVLACFVWVVYIGVGSLYKQKEHICVGFLLNYMSESMKKFVLLFNDIVMFVASAIIAYYALVLTSRSFHKPTPTMKIPYSFIDIAVAFGFVYVLIDLGIKAFRAISRKEDVA